MRLDVSGARTRSTYEVWVRLSAHRPSSQTVIDKLESNFRYTDDWHIVANESLRPQCRGVAAQLSLALSFLVVNKMRPSVEQKALVEPYVLHLSRSSSTCFAETFDPSFFVVCTELAD